MNSMIMFTYFLFYWSSSKINEIVWSLGLFCSPTDPPELIFFSSLEFEKWFWLFTWLKWLRFWIWRSPLWVSLLAERAECYKSIPYWLVLSLRERPLRVLLWLIIPFPDLTDRFVFWGNAKFENEDELLYCLRSLASILEVMISILLANSPKSLSSKIVSRL